MSRRAWLSTACLGLPGALCAVPASAAEAPKPPTTTEPRQRLAPDVAGQDAPVALTLDACGGQFDATAIETLVRLQVPATLFLTQRWMRRQPDALKLLLSHRSLFALENHGAEHRPAVVGGRLYGMAGPPTIAGVQAEIEGGARALTEASGQRPRWYRGAGARYDAASLDLIAQLGYRVAGYSLNADDGATAPAATVGRRLKAARPGDIILGHMNHPAGGTAAGLAAALPALLDRGLRFVQLGDHAIAPEIPR